jgi:AAA domain
VHIYRLIAAGELRAVDIATPGAGRTKTRIRGDDLANYIDRGKAAPVGRQMVVTLASQIKPRPVRWLWADQIPAGALTLLAGREGIGKSLVGVYLAAQLTRGTLAGGRHGRPSRVMFATSEDAWEFTMVPRLLAAGADLARVGRVQVEDDGIVIGLTAPVDVPALKVYIATHDVAMLVLDPLTSVMDGRIDARRDREVRKALEPLGQLAEDTGAAVLGLVHLGKGMGNDPVNLILGSRAFSAGARVALVAARDPEDETSNVLSVEKSNLGRIDVPGLVYRISWVPCGCPSAAAEREHGPGHVVVYCEAVPNCRASWWRPRHDPDYLAGG